MISLTHRLSPQKTRGGQGYVRIKIVCGQHGAQCSIACLILALLIWECVDLVVGLLAKLIILVCYDFARYPLSVRE